MGRLLRVVLTIAITLGALVALAPVASAASTCQFDTSGTTMELQGDCITDETIRIPDGFTLDGNGHEIAATNSGGGFKGAVVMNEGHEAHVTNLIVSALGADAQCESSASNPEGRLRGIMLKGASGSITNNTVKDILQTPTHTGCQEGIGIGVRNEPYDGNHPNTQTVEVSHNTVSNYQKGGIVAIGDVEVTITYNTIDVSGALGSLAPNSIQISNGASGLIAHNLIAGSTWTGPSNYASSAILVYMADEVTVTENTITGNSDVGIYVYLTNNAKVTFNRIFDQGTDTNQYGYDVGIGHWDSGGSASNNWVDGFTDPIDGNVDAGSTRIGSLELCANRHNGKLSMRDDNCRRSSTEISLPADGSITLCVKQGNAAANVSWNGQCHHAATTVEVPFGPDVLQLCVNRSNGNIRVSDDCRHSEYASLL